VALPSCFLSCAIFFFDSSEQNVFLSQVVRGIQNLVRSTSLANVSEDFFLLRLTENPSHTRLRKKKMIGQIQLRELEVRLATWVACFFFFNGIYASYYF
jgi:hypothetical protein